MTKFILDVSNYTLLLSFYVAIVEITLGEFFQFVCLCLGVSVEYYDVLTGLTKLLQLVSTFIRRQYLNRTYNKNVMNGSSTVMFEGDKVAMSGIGPVSDRVELLPEEYSSGPAEPTEPPSVPQSKEGEVRQGSGPLLRARPKTLVVNSQYFRRANLQFSFIVLVSTILTALLLFFQIGVPLLLSRNHKYEYTYETTDCNGPCKIAYNSNDWVNNGYVAQNESLTREGTDLLYMVGLQSSDRTILLFNYLGDLSDFANDTLVINTGLDPLSNAYDNGRVFGDMVAVYEDEDGNSTRKTELLDNSIISGNSTYGNVYIPRSGHVGYTQYYANMLNYNMTQATAVNAYSSQTIGDGYGDLEEFVDSFYSDSGYSADFPGTVYYYCAKGKVFPINSTVNWYLTSSDMNNDETFYTDLGFDSSYSNIKADCNASDIRGYYMYFTANDSSYAIGSFFTYNNHTIVTRVDVQVLWMDTKIYYPNDNKSQIYITSNSYQDTAELMTNAANGGRQVQPLEYNTLVAKVDATHLVESVIFMVCWNFFVLAVKFFDQMLRGAYVTLFEMVLLKDTGFALDYTLRRNQLRFLRIWDGTKNHYCVTDRPRTIQEKPRAGYLML